MIHSVENIGIRVGLRLTLGGMSRLLIVLALFFAWGCKPRPEVADTRPADPVPAESPRKFDFRPAAASDSRTEVPQRELSSPRFTNVAEAIGIRHVYDNGSSPKALMVESTGGGAGWIDLDADGRLDLYLTQGGPPDAPSPNLREPDRFFRQLSVTEFIDIAGRAGIDERGYGHAVAVGDFDNDGFDDLFVTNVGENSLYVNLGDGTFEKRNDRLAGAKHVWSASAAWGDIDRDGDLDLYVCNYADYDPYHPLECLDVQGVPSICHPRNVDPVPDEFYLNDGQGKLVESSAKFHLTGPGNKALGVVIADLTGDSWPDIFVANDTTANFVFVNKQGRDFEESAFLLGGAFSATGATQASMGIAFGDYDDNHWPDLCLTHFTGEHNTLYKNLGPQGFQDVSALTGLREPSLPKLGFGIVMSDFNADGAMDLFVTNGHIDPRYAMGEEYEMVPQLFSFDGAKWREMSAQAGPIFSQRLVGRAVATADYDGDGDLDLCVVHHNSPTAILRNDSHRGHWLRVKPLGRISNRSGFGAKATVDCGGRRRVGEVAGGTSYNAAHERALDFGLGETTGPCVVMIEWPSGTIDRVELSQPDQTLFVPEGSFPFAKPE